MDELPCRRWSEAISAPLVTMKCSNTTGERAVVCMQHTLRRTSLTCNLSKMILVTYKSDVHPTAEDVLRLHPQLPHLRGWFP
jgi:hypothetical protein